VGSQIDFWALLGLKWSLVATVLTKNFQITFQKVVVTVTTTFKNSKVVVACHYRHIQSNAYN